MLDSRVIFLSVVDTGSFASASRQLGVARSTIMRRVDELEARLGVTLIQRVGNQIVLTVQGRRYAEALRPLLSALHRVEQGMVEQEPSGALRVWLPILGTGEELAPAMAAFQKQHPKIIVHLEMGRDVRQLRLGAFDVALQLGFRQNQAFHARTLFRERMILVAHRDYIEQRGMPQSIEEAAKEHVAIYEQDVEGRLVHWREPGGEKIQMPRAGVYVNSVGFAFCLACEGIGIVRVPRMLAAQKLACGELLHVLPSVWTEEHVNLLFLPNPTPIIRVFVDFIAEWFGAFDVHLDS